MKRIPTEKLRNLIRKWQPVLATPWGVAAESPDFGEACRELGFDMDCAQSLQAQYPGAKVFRASFLRGIIASIDDVHGLGSAIFSYWRYLTHWHDAPPPDDAPEWFAVALGRLAELADSPGDERAESSPFKSMKNYRWVKRITIAGVRYLKDRGQVMAMTAPGAVLRLVREVDNDYDDHAVRVDLWGGQKLGYVPRRENSELAEAMARGIIFVGVVTVLRRQESWVDADIYELLHFPFPDFAGFTLRTFGFFAAETRCSIFPGSRRFVYKQRSPEDGMIRGVDFTFAPAGWERAMELIQRCNFLAWESEYPNPCVCDGMQWTMTIRRRHEKSLKISGDNAYPEEWEILNDFIESCLDFHEVKGNGRIFLELPPRSAQGKVRPRRPL